MSFYIEINCPSCFGPLPIEVAVESQGVSSDIPWLQSPMEWYVDGGNECENEIENEDGTRRICGCVVTSKDAQNIVDKATREEYRKFERALIKQFDYDTDGPDWED